VTDAGPRGRLVRDPLNGAWTVIAPRRLARPHDTPDSGAPAGRDAAVGTSATATVADCPFCRGHEQLTPPEVDALRPDGSAPDTPGWTVRVVPNKFPAFEGGHEVVVHSPRHDLPLHAQPLDEVTDVVAMYQRRVAALCAGGAAAVTVILNHGRAAGASLAHPHSQIFATPIVPPVLVSELEQFARYRVKYDRCLLCDMVRAAADEGSRLVFDGPLVAWTPDASRWPYEVRLAPRAHEPDFLRAEPGAVAFALKHALAAIAAATGDAPLNAWLHTVPCPAGARGGAEAARSGADGEPAPPFHWHFEIAPRLTTLAGFELGTGIAIDTVEPREAAARLRAALPETIS
jgi:UDPglucose--hexose-1-phosphate uridylyltransferase